LWHPDLSDREVEMIDGLYRYALEQRERMGHYWQRNELSRTQAGGSV
jgi:hypothetical protein